MAEKVDSTTYYETVEEWKAAGSPGGTETEGVVIGSPPRDETPPPETTPEPSPEPEPTPAPSQSLEDREQELKQAIDYSEKVASGEAQLGEDEDTTAYWKSVEDIKARLENLQQARDVRKSYEEAGQELTLGAKQYIERAEAMIASPAAPFIQISPEGKIEVISKLTTAEKVGVSLAEFEKMGFKPETLADIKRQEEITAELKKYNISTPEGKAAAIREGKIELLREAAALGFIQPQQGNISSEVWKTLSQEEKVGLTLLDAQLAVSTIPLTRSYIDRIASENNIPIGNRDSLSLDEMDKLITAGVDPRQLVLEGQDILKVNQAVGVINQRYEEWQNKIKSGEIIQSRTGDYITKDGYDSLPDEGKQAWMIGGFDALSTAEQYISDYKAGDGHNLGRLVYDSRKSKNPRLVENAAILYGEGEIDKVKETVFGVSPKILSMGVDEIVSMIDKAPRSSKEVIWDEVVYAANRLGLKDVGTVPTKDGGYLLSPTQWWSSLSQEDKQAIAGEYTGRRLIEPEMTAAWIVRTKYSIEDWKKGELPKTADVAYLESVAAPDFYDRGGTSKEAIALDNAMRTAGFKFPSGSGRVDFRNLSDEEKEKVAKAWGSPGPLEEYYFEQVVPPTVEGLEAIKKWSKERTGFVPTLSTAVLSGAANILGAITVMIPATVLSSAERAAMGRVKGAGALVAEVPLGMLQWAAVDSIMRIRENPVYGSGALLGEIFGIPVIKGLVKSSIQVPGILAGRRLGITSIEYTPDVARAGVRPGMAERYGQSAVQQVVDVLNKESPSITKLHAPDGHSALAIKLGNRITVIETLPKVEMTPQQTAAYLNQAWGGNVPNALVVYSPDVQVAMTEALTGNVATQTAGGLGGAVGFQTAWQKVFPQTGFHATGDLTPFETALAEQGYYVVKPGDRPVEFMSPQFPEAFRVRGLTENNGGLAQFFSANDLQPLPSDLIGDAMNPGVHFTDVQAELMRRAMLPESDPQRIPQGIYPVFKHYTPEGGVPTYELEFVATPGFKWNALPPSWFMPKDVPTASIKVPSAISYIDPETGIEIKGGQPYKMLFVASDNAIKEGVRAPTLAKLQAVWALDKTIYAVNRLLAPKEIRRMAKGGELAATESTGIRALKLQKPEVIKAEATAKEVAKKYEGKVQEPFTNEQLGELGEWIDENGRILRTRDRYWHPDAERLDPTKGWVRSKGLVIVQDPKTGDVFVVKVADALSLPEGALEAGKTVEEAIAENFVRETGVPLVNIRRMPIYYGKVAEDAMPGSPILYAEPASLEFNKPQIDATSVTEKNGIIKGDKVNEQGLITETEGVHFHPKIGGKVRRRVSAVVINNEGHPLVVTDKLEPMGYYGLPGGGFVEPGGASSPTGGAWSQMRDEMGLEIENMQQLPAYLGQVNRHSLPGSYMIFGEVKDPTIDLNWFARNFPNDPLVKRGITEIKEAKFWDGKTPISVSPATYDVFIKLISEGKIKGDATKLSISDKTPFELLTARDTNYYRPADLNVGGVDWSRIQLGKPEVIRLKSGDAGIVDPDTYEILKSIEGFDVSKLRVKDKGWSKSYMKWRDTDYAKRAIDKTTQLKDASSVANEMPEEVIRKVDAEAQQIVDGIAEKYHLASKPAYKFTFMEKLGEILTKQYLLERGRADGWYEPDTGTIHLWDLEHPETVLHELVHPELDSKLNPKIVKALNELVGKDDISYAKVGGLIVPKKGELARAIASGFDELATIEYVKRIGGYEATSYRYDIGYKLKDIGEKYGIPDLQKKVNAIAQQFIDGLNVRHIEDIVPRESARVPVEVIPESQQAGVVKGQVPSEAEVAQRIIEGKTEPIAVRAEEEMLPYRPKGELPYVSIVLGELKAEPMIGEGRLGELAITESIMGELGVSEPTIGELKVAEPTVEELRATELRVAEVGVGEPVPEKPVVPEEPVEPVPEKPVVPEEPIIPPPLILKPKGDKEYAEQVAKIQPGTVVWIQGRPLGSGGQERVPMWKVLPPPYKQEDFFTMRETPPGAVDEGWSGKGMSKKSLQIIGGLPASNIENIDLGWARINVNVAGGKPEIEYVHDTEANVGERSQTVGMGKGQIPLEAWEEAKAQGISYEDFIRSYRGEMVDGKVKVVSTPIAQVEETEEAEIESEPEPVAVEEETPKQEKEITGIAFASSGGNRKVDRMLDTFAGVERREDGQLLEGEAEEDSGLLKEQVSEDTDVFWGKSILDAEPTEEGEEELPATVVQSYIRRKKPKGNLKNWWESQYYEDISVSPPKKSVESGIAERTYLGHKLLPPDLGASI